MSRWRNKNPIDRFLEKISKNGESGCWEWLGAIRGNTGYGGFHDGQGILAHRWSYQYFIGPIPKGLDIDHLCRNRKCVNPEHLEVVTREVNVRRGKSWKREETHCKNGHEWTAQSTYWRTRNGALRRDCKICKSLHRKNENRERRNENQRSWRAARRLNI